jgi:glycine cleavage system H protein
MSDEYPSDLKYTTQHEWARVDGKVATIGISKFAVDQLGDVVTVELPKEGESFKRGDVIGTVESVKAVSDIYAPLSGKVVKVNTPLADTPEYVNDDCYDEGWMVQLECTNESELKDLMDAGAYVEFIREQEGD